MNKVFLEGRLGDAPRIVRGDKGSIARLRVATNEVIHRADGTTDKTTEWHTVIAFNALAEACETLKKGDAVSLNGHLSTRSFQKQDGSKHSETQVIAAWISVPLQRARAASPSPAQAAQPAQAAPASTPPPPVRQPAPATHAAEPATTQRPPVRYANGSPEGVVAEANATVASRAIPAAVPEASAPQPHATSPVARQQAPVDEIPASEDPFFDMDQVLREQLESA